MSGLELMMCLVRANGLLDDVIRSTVHRVVVSISSSVTDFSEAKTDMPAGTTSTTVHRKTPCSLLNRILLQPGFRKDDCYDTEYST